MQEYFIDEVVWNRGNHQFLIAILAILWCVGPGAWLGYALVDAGYRRSGYAVIAGGDAGVGLALLSLLGFDLGGFLCEV